MSLIYTIIGVVAGIAIGKLHTFFFAIADDFHTMEVSIVPRIQVSQLPFTYSVKVNIVDANGASVPDAPLPDGTHVTVISNNEQALTVTQDEGGLSGTVNVLAFPDGIITANGTLIAQVIDAGGSEVARGTADFEILSTTTTPVNHIESVSIDFTGLTEIPA